MAEYGLASVVCHRGFLLETLPSHHPLFSSYLFRHTTALEELSTVVVERCAETQDKIQPTGIPQSVYHTLQLKEMKGVVEKLCTYVFELTPKVVSGVEDVLERNGVQAGTVTRSGFQEMLRSGLEQAGLISMANAFQSGESFCQPSTADVPVENARFQWNLLLRPLPAAFEMNTRDTTRTAWHLWWFRNARKGIRPYRSIQCREIMRDWKPRFSEFSKLMRAFESHLISSNQFVTPRTESDADEMFEKLVTTFNLHSREGDKRTTRPPDRSWRTAFRKLKKQKLIQ